MYGLSFAKKIPLKGISCARLLQLSIPVSKIKKTAIYAKKIDVQGNDLWAS